MAIGGFESFALVGLPPSWECWALWEPLPIRVSEASIDKVTIDHPHLRSAAAMLGVPLLGF